MIINTHPREREANHTLKVIATLVEKYQEPVVHISDKTVSEWQAIITSDEPMRFVGPVYWWGMGHEFEKWMQEVLSYGFAYQYENNVPVGLLDGRAFEVYLTHGTPAEHAEVMRTNITERLTKGVFGMCRATATISFFDQSQITSE
jgi:NAD(P)H dehydrogenase (quinone)